MLPAGGSGPLSALYWGGVAAHDALLTWWLDTAFNRIAGVSPNTGSS